MCLYVCISVYTLHLYLCILCEALIVWNIYYYYALLYLLTYIVLILDYNLFQEKKCIFCSASLCDFLPNPIYILIATRDFHKYNFSEIPYLKLYWFYK